MTKKIGVLYLDVLNLGDIVIYETAKYIIEDILKKKNIDYELIPLRIGSIKCRDLRKNMPRIIDFCARAISSAWRRLGEQKIITHMYENISIPLLKFTFHRTDAYKYYSKFEKDKIKNCDMLIIAGGGWIKFHRQNFHFFLDDILAEADKRNIPVLINAQGIEGYDEKDSRCLILKKAINRNCVKYISTRDDYNMLRYSYIYNPNITVESVCDPAFWVKETYSLSASNNNSRKIGLNVIRTNIFGEYMYKIGKDFLGKLYYDLIVKLCENNYEVELFSNGIGDDVKFISRLFQMYPELTTKYHVTIATPATAEELVHVIANYYKIMAVRLHASIIGTALGIPNISLVWNRKQKLFGSQIGMVENYLDKEQFQVDSIFNALMKSKPYVMDEKYKLSVYNSLEKQINNYL